MCDKEVPKPRKKPIMHIMLLFMSHRVLVSFLCCIAGVIALLILPLLAKNTYISENALMPGSSNPVLSGQDVSDANKLITEILSLKFDGDSVGLKIPRVLEKHMTALGAEASHFQFHPHPNKFHPLHFFSSLDDELISEKENCSWPGVSTAGIIRAPRGDGKEAIVLVTPYNAVKPDVSEVLSLGVACSVFTLLTRVTWLAKDIIWLAADSRYGEHEAVATWLREYYAPRFGSLRRAHTSLCSAHNDPDILEENRILSGQDLEMFKRAGTMAAALVIKVNKNQESGDSLSIVAEASNGQMPNLDLVNVVNYLAVHRQHMHVKVGKLSTWLDSKYLKMFGETIEYLGDLAGSLNPQWNFGVPVGKYVEGIATLASSLYAQALGIPSGSHGAFRDYQVDAVTLEISTKAWPYNYVKRSDFLLQSGWLVEGVIRSVNNLLEKFHQSFFLYLLTGPSTFVSVGVYMIAFALLIAPLPLVAASLYLDTVQSSSDSRSSVELVISRKSWRWLPAAKTVFVVHLWAVVVALLPLLVCQVPNRTPTTSILSWFLLSLISLPIFYTVLGSPFSTSKSSQLHNQHWAVLKSVMIAAAFIGLSLMSIVNFAAAEIGALLLVPLCLMAQPLKLDLRMRSVKTFARIPCNVVLAMTTFPPLTFLLMKGCLEGFSSGGFGDFWDWAESLWLWNSATYLYVSLVHFPCWVLCVHILLHPC